MKERFTILFSVSLWVVLLNSLIVCPAFAWGDKKVATSITFKNSTEYSVTAIVHVTDKDEVSVFHQEYSVPPGTPLADESGKQIRNADGSPKLQNGTFNIEKILLAKNKIKISYKAAGSSASIPVFQDTVPETDEKYIIIPEVSNIQQYNEDYSTNQLSQLATQIGATGAKKRKLVDVIPLLGTLFVASKDDKGEIKDVSDHIKFADIKLEAREADVIKSTVSTTQDATAKFSVSVPIYGGISSNMVTGTLYNLIWDIKHYLYTNSTFSPTTALSKATDEQLKVIKSALENNVSTDIYYIYEMHVIPSAIFSIAKGTKISGEVNAAIASVFTASGTYAFNQKDESYYFMSDDVLDIKLTPYSDRTALLNWISAKLNQPEKVKVMLLPDKNEKPTVVPKGNKILDAIIPQ